MSLRTERFCTVDQINAFLNGNETADYLPKDRDGYVINLVDEVTQFELRCDFVLGRPCDSPSPRQLVHHCGQKSKAVILHLLEQSPGHCTGDGHISAGYGLRRHQSEGD